MRIGVLAVQGAFAEIPKGKIEAARKALIK